MAGEQARGSGFGALTLHTPCWRRQTGLGWGGGILRPAPTADQPRLGELAGEGSVARASELQAGQRDTRTEWEPRSYPARPGEPSWLASLCLPSLILGYPHRILDAWWARGSGKRPQSRAMGAELSPARLIREGGGNAVRQVGRALGTNFGVPRFSASLGPGSSARGSQVELPVYLKAPPPSRLPAVGLPGLASALPCCRAPAAAAAAAGSGGGGGSTPGASVRWRGQPGLGSPLSGPARVQITTWLAAGAPEPARRRPLQLVAKFMPAALQRWPQSAPFPPPGSAPCARKVEFRGFKLLIGISHCCVTRGGGDTHAAHSHTLTHAATSGCGLKGEAVLPRPRPLWL